MKSKEQLKQEIKEQVAKDSLEYVDKVYDKIYKKSRVKVIVKSKDGHTSDCIRSEFGLPYFLEELVLQLNDEGIGSTSIGEVKIDKKNLKSIEIIFD